MITTRNNFSGAAFDYSNTNCTASGEYRCLNDALQTVNINGQYVKEGASYGFFANRDEQRNVNISGVPYTVIADVAEEVATIISEIETIITPSDETESAE